MEPTNERCKWMIVVALLLAGTTAFAEGPLRGTFEGQARGSLKMLRGVPRVRMTSRVRMSVVEKDGAVTIRASAVQTSIGRRDVQAKHLGGTPLETVATGRIIADSTTGGERRLRILFDGPAHTAATQKAMDEASRAGGQAKSGFTVEGAAQVMEVLQRRDGSLHIVEASAIRRGPTKGFLNRLLLKRTITSESTIDLRPAGR